MNVNALLFIIQKFCEIFREETNPILKTLAESSDFPEAFKNAIEHLMMISQEVAECNSVCEGVKNSLCNALVRLGIKFMNLNDKTGLFV